MLAGVAWVTNLTCLYTSAQNVLPDWVRGRGLAIFLTVIFGTMTLSSAAWGDIAAKTGLPTALLLAAGARSSAIPLTWRWTLQQDAALDLSPSQHWGKPQTHEEIDNDRGPVLVKIEYRIDPKDRVAFLRALDELGFERRRDGAFAWGIFEDAGEFGRYEETYLIESWLELMHLRERVTNADRVLEDEIREMLIAPPRIEFLVAAERGPRVQHRRSRAGRSVSALRILVVYAHPLETSFVSALHARVVETLRAGGHIVDDLDLYAERFDPVMSREQFAAYVDIKANTREVESYVERLRAAEALVLVFPVWFDGLPAILQGYFQRVFLPGVSLRIDEAGPLSPELVEPQAHGRGVHLWRGPARRRRQGQSGAAFRALQHRRADRSEGPVRVPRPLRHELHDRAAAGGILEARDARVRGVVSTSERQPRRSEGEFEPGEGSVHPLLVAEAPRLEGEFVEAGVLMGVGVHDAIADGRCDVLGPVVADRGERLPGCGVGPAAEVGEHVHEPAVVEAIVRGEAGDRHDPVLVHGFCPVEQSERAADSELGPL